MLSILLALAIWPLQASLPQDRRASPADAVAAKSQKLLGAKEVIRQAQIPPKSNDAVKALEAEAADVLAKQPGQTPKAATEAFLGLVRDWEAQFPDPTKYGDLSETAWRALMTALPSPDTWPLIRQGLTKLSGVRTRSIIAFFDDLLGNDVAVLKYIESQVSQETDEQLRDPFGKKWGAELAIALRVGDLDLAEKIYLRKLESDSFPSFPDLVSILGRTRAESVIRAILEASNGSVKFAGKETRKLAREIVMSDLAHVKSPQWDLVEGPNDYAFVALQAAKFGDENLANYFNAALAYANGLAKAGKIDEAIRFYSSQQQRPEYSWPVYTYRDEAGTEETYVLFSRLLDRKWIPCLVPDCVSYGLSLGRTEEVVKRIDGWLARASPNAPPSSSDPGPLAREYLLAVKGQLDFAAGRTSQGIDEFERAIQIAAEPDPEEITGMLARELLDIAVALRDPAPIDFLAKIAPTMGTRGSNLGFFGAYDRMGLIEKAQAEIVTGMGDVNNVYLGADGQGRLLGAFPETGARLARIYYEADEPVQIVTLLHEFPKWGAADLIDVLTSTQYGVRYWDGSTSQPLGFYAAWALAKTGEKSVAIQALDDLIRIDLRDDEAYRMLNELDGSGAIPFYDEIIRLRPGENRPQIWKADLLLRIGKVGDAEKLVRAAIALNPTDSRRIANEVLGGIAKAEGKETEAARCEAIVKGARLAEQAAQVEDTGLYAMAAGLYEQALATSPDDCAAHMGYAGVLWRMRRKSEAVTQYEKALELAPVSGGPFGGIDYDDSDYARGVASGIIERLRQGHPGDPAVLTAVGEVEAARGDFKSALADFEEAVKADPDYLRAWERIADLPDQSALTRTQASEATVAVIRLSSDHQFYYYRNTSEHSSDYAALWRAYHDWPEVPLPPGKGPLYPLEASQRSLANGMRSVGNGGAPAEHETPGSMLAAIGELQALFP